MIRLSLLRRWIIELENSGMPICKETIKRTIEDMKRELELQDTLNKSKQQ